MNKIISRMKSSHHSISIHPFIILNQFISSCWKNYLIILNQSISLFWIKSYHQPKTNSLIIPAESFHLTILNQFIPSSWIIYLIVLPQFISLYWKINLVSCRNCNANLPVKRGIQTVEFGRYKFNYGFNLNHPEKKEV